MEVGYKLATQGVLGADMYAGFFGADQHHLFTLPLQHVLDALAFRLFGAGVAQARWVSVLAAVSTVWLVGWLVYRWYGLGTALLCEFLLTAWRSNVVAGATGLPLLEVGRTARYDILAVAAVWIAISLLDLTLRRPRPITAFLLGMSSGLASLAQFFGVFVVPLVAIAWLWIRRRSAADATAAWIIVGAAIVILPWVAYCARYADDLSGQLVVYGNRGDFLSLEFYVANVLDEPSRFSHLILTSTTAEAANGETPDTPISAWLLVVCGLPAVAYVAWRSRRRDATGDRLLLTSLFTFAGLLLVLDRTKVALYAILLLPSICVAIAACWTGTLAWAWRQRRRAPFLTSIVAVTSPAILLVLASEADHAYRLDRLAATQVSSYLDFGQQIEAAVPPGAVVVGPERWWWALHNHPYLSLRSIWWQWSAAATNNTATPSIVDWINRFDAEIVIVNINVRADIEAFPAPLQKQFWTFIDNCTTRVADLDNPNYFETEVYLIARPLPPAEECLDSARSSTQ